MLDEIHEYIQKHETMLLKEKNRLTLIPDDEYNKMIDKVKESNQRLKDVFLYEDDPDEAIKRLTLELSLINDLGMRSMQETLK